MVSHFLEDLGYYCVDNLPAKLIPIFVDLWRRKEVQIDKVALVVDIREHGFLRAFPESLGGHPEEDRPEADLPRRLGRDARQTLQRDAGGPIRCPRKSILQGVRLERRRMAPIKKMADEVIDTSATIISQLKEIVRPTFLQARKAPAPGVDRQLRLQIRHPLRRRPHLRYPVPPESVLPRRPPEQDRTGSAPSGISSSDADETQAFLAELFRFIGFLMPRFVAEGKSHLVIAIGCTGGRHRSVVVAERSGITFAKRKYDIKIFHRDLFK